MHLKTLTLRGFKSFASSSTLRFEPGITCVVGPNGSGKSNIVDALSWVMGEQGVKSLRGGKMEDVVFAGTTSRPPLGRAEVTLTIDNSDGALPIDYAEVTISRLLFRSGQSEYAINGDHCRLLDVQELLSDSGLGREMHVIVGQGQLDEVLHAGPEARRALIEEAAGVLKHRKRKEKALRKLEAMQANLIRLVDLTTELGRRLKPLGRQAEIARKAAVIQADLRDARLRLLADDYLTLAAELEAERAGEAVVAARRAELEAELTAARAAEAELEAAAREQAPRLAQAQETWFALSALAERLRGVASLAAERHRHLSAEPEPDRPGRDPGALEAEAAAFRAQEAALAERLAACRERLDTAVTARKAAEAALTEVERQIASHARDAAARADRLAKLRAQVGAARSRGAAAEEEISRLAAALAQAQERAEQAEAEHVAQQELAAGREDGRAELSAAHQQAAAAVSQAAERVAALRRAEHQASSERAALRARKETLEEAFSQGGDASELLLGQPGQPGRFGGVLGSFASMLTVDEGWQQAIAAALGAAADAVAVAGLDEAVAILGALRASGSGSASLVIAGPAATNGRGGGAPGSQDMPAGLAATNGRRGEAAGEDAPPAGLAAANGHGGGGAAVAGLGSGNGHGGGGAADAGLGSGNGHGGGVSAGRDAAAGRAAGNGRGHRPDAPGSPDAPPAHERFAAVLVADALPAPAQAAGARAALGLVRAPAAAVGVLRQLLGGVVVADDLTQAAEIVRADASLRVVTRDGDLLGAHWAHGGSAKPPSLLEIRAAADAAAAALTAADRRCQQAERDLAAAAQDEEQARQALAQAQARLREADSEAAGVSGRIGLLAGAARGAIGEADRLDKALQAARRARETDLAHFEDLERRLAKAEAEEADQAGAPGRPDEAARHLRAQKCDLARTAEMEVRLEVRTAEERSRAITGRADALAAAAVAERQARDRAAARLAQRRRHAAITRAVAVGAQIAIARIERSVELAQAERLAAERATARRAEQLSTLRARATALSGELDALVDRAHSAEIVAAEHRMRLEQISGRAAEEFGIEPDALVTEYGPGVLLQVPDGEDTPLEPPRYHRAEQERRAQVAERQLAQLGKVNPLALEEFAALQERHAFLGTQLEDLKKTRRDLLTVVKEVDERVQQVFASAYEDTAREFETIFARLFPGGEGRLVLTEPDDMLATGIEVEARPPGKKIKRLSLLSGGERSLTAIAFLLAIFKARPSPFYVLDEVEAALDDTNLQRLLGILEELRQVSQLIVVTHQKRTMEVADSLYGISMRGDGVSAVVSQRLRERV